MLTHDGDWTIDIRRRTSGLKKETLLKRFLEITMGPILLLRLSALKIVTSLRITEMCFCFGVFGGCLTVFIVPWLVCILLDIQAQLIFFLSNLTIGRLFTFCIYFIDNDAIFLKPWIMLKSFYKSIVKTSVFVLILLS